MASSQAAAGCQADCREASSKGVPQGGVHKALLSSGLKRCPQAPPKQPCVADPGASREEDWREHKRVARCGRKSKIGGSAAEPAELDQRRIEARPANRDIAEPDFRTEPQ